MINRKLGKLPVKHDKRNLLLSAYVSPRLPAPPIECKWDKPIPSWPMFKNDEIGDCTCAAIGHTVLLWTSHARNPINVGDDAVISLYRAVSGYDGSPDTDRGAVCLDVLKYMRKKGIKWPSGDFDNLGAFMQVNPRNKSLIKAGIWLMGVVYTGFDLPLSAQDQEVWDVVEGEGEDALAGSWGGHCMAIVGYDAYGVEAITWGGVKRITWAFFMKYCTEAYALCDADWIKSDGKAPNGFDAATLRKDLLLL